MGISDRIEGSVEKWSANWGNRLKDWLSDALKVFLGRFLVGIFPPANLAMLVWLNKVKNDPNSPPEQKAFANEVISGTSETQAWVEMALAVIGAIPGLLAVGKPQANLIEYAQDKVIKSFRLDPQSVITAWRRDNVAYNKYFDDLRDQGVSDDRIEAMKFFTQVIPQAQDIIRFALREVYTPEIAEKYGQFQDIPTGAYEDAAKAGLPTATFDKFWAAHWYLPSTSEGFELLHRGIITEDELRALLKANDIMPYWRDQLIKLSWNIPTRVDVRRFWDMRTIDETRLREIYTGLGYHAQDLEDYVLWTKIYVDFPDLLARYKNGWITLDQVREELIAMGMKPERADTMIEEKIKKAAPERVAAEKDLTKADIISGVKKDVITRVQAAELLVDIGYSNDEAIYLLDVNIPTDEVTSVKTARELTKSDILAGLKAGVITETDALGKLRELRYTAADADFILKVYKAAAKPPAEANLKEASKADIVTAVKKGLITQEAGYMMLLDIGFSAEAALFILSVATEESPFSPVTFGEFKDLTQKYRKASGLEGPAMNEDIRKAAAEVIRITGERDSLRQAIDKEQRGLIGEEILPMEATARLDKLKSSLRKAEAELSRAKTEYGRLVAELKHIP